jgi:ABC-type enterochelin transport system substrate-binding protein
MKKLDRQLKMQGAEKEPQYEKINLKISNLVINNINTKYAYNYMKNSHLIDVGYPTGMYRTIQVWLMNLPCIFNE